jgi:hypothetical protein
LKLRIWRGNRKEEKENPIKIKKEDKIYKLILLVLGLEFVHLAQT